MRATNESERAKPPEVTIVKSINVEGRSSSDEPSEPESVSDSLAPAAAAAVRASTSGHRGNSAAAAAAVVVGCGDPFDSSLARSHSRSHSFSTLLPLRFFLCPSLHFQLPVRQSQFSILLEILNLLNFYNFFYILYFFLLFFISID